ncbi:phage tail protein [Cupriavidus basilensis]
MIDAYAIGTTLKLRDLISPQLIKLAQEFTKVDALALQVNKRLQKMGAEVVGVRNLATAARQLNAGLRGIGDQALRAERNLYNIRGAIPSGGIGLEAELVRANTQAATLQARIAAMRGAGRVPGGGNPILPPGPGGGGWGGGRRPGHIHGGNMHVGPNGFGIGGVGMGMATNMLVPLAAAGATIYIGHKFYESAKDLQTEQARFRLYGLNDEQNRSAYSFAHRMREFGTSETQAMHFVNEAQGVFRESGESGEHALAGAKMAAPFLAKMMAASSILSSESKAKLEHESMAMLRAIELQGGAKNTDQFAKLADFGFRITQTSAKQVNWEQIRQMNSIGGMAVQRLGMDTIAELEPIIGEFKGGKFATALNTAYGRMNGIVKLPNQAVHELIKAKIWDGSKVELNANGGIKRFLGNPLVDAEEYAKRPAEYYYKHMRPFYDQQGYKDTDRDRMNSMFFGRTGGALFSKIDQQESIIKLAGEAFRKALGIDAALEIAKGNATGAEADFKAAWTDFKTEFGKNMLPAITGMLEVGASILRTISGTAGEKETADGPPKPSVWQRGKTALANFLDGSSFESPDPQGGPGGKPINPVASKGDSVIKIHVNGKVDGRTLLQFVAEGHGRELSRPQTGPALFDQSLSPRPPSLK